MQMLRDHGLGDSRCGISRMLWNTWHFCVDEAQRLEPPIGRMRAHYHKLAIDEDRGESTSPPLSQGHDASFVPQLTNSRASSHPSISKTAIPKLSGSPHFHHRYHPNAESITQKCVVDRYGQHRGGLGHRIHLALAETSP